MTNLEKRLLAKVSVDVESGCWNWTASKNSSGYGQFQVGGKPQKAHRLSYEIHHGVLPNCTQVLHHCDNRACINPRHLFVGTNADNMADRDAKGRQARGAANGRAKLSEEDVLSILTGSLSRKECAARYQISTRQVTHIRARKSWAHLRVTEGFAPQSMAKTTALKKI